MYRGRLLLAEDDEPARSVDVWRAGDVAVVFDGGTQLGVARGIVVELDGAGRLRITGRDDDGAPVVWRGADPSRIGGSWHGMTVKWADGTTDARATVSWSQYGVTVGVNGKPNRELPGAKAMVQGAQRLIRHGDDMHLIESGSRGCGCGGR